MNHWLIRLQASAWGLMLFGLGIVEILVASVIVIVVCLSVTIVGALAIPPAIALARGLANASRRLAARWGAPIPVPYEPSSAGPPGLWRRILELGSERATWRDLLWLVTDPFTSACLAAVPGALIVYGLFGAAVQPLIWVQLDLREAILTERETLIRADAVMAGIEIIVPNDVAVHVEGVGFMGAFDETPGTAPPQGAPVIRITGVAFWAGIAVKRTPTYPPKQRRDELTG